MLVDKLGGIVDLVVDHHEEVLLGVVLSNILVRERLLGHFVCIFFFFFFFGLSRLGLFGVSFGSLPLVKTEWFVRGFCS